MGLIVKILGTGLGFASEAISAARSHSRSPGPCLVESSSLPTAGPHPAPDDSIERVEDHDEPAAEYLIQHGLARQMVDSTEKEKDSIDSKAIESGYYDHHNEENEHSEACFDEDEAAWELDEIAEHIAPPSYEDSETALKSETEQARVANKEQMIRRLVHLAGPPARPTRRIPCPVIIPQRRPRAKDRGFVRAYAPVLGDCGISQDVFLQFLKDWHQASKASPWIDVVFIAAGIAGFAPEVATIVVTTVIQVVAGTARELQSRYRQNTYLDRVNEDLFMPRGLFAMVMAFKDNVPGEQGGVLSQLAGALGKTLFSAQRLNIDQTAAKYSASDPSMSRFKKGLKDIRLNSGQTYGEVELPEAALLVYPDLDRVVEGGLREKHKTEEPGMKEKWKLAGKWVQDYMDRKAQAFYEAQHPNSSLAVPSTARKEFTSRYNNPNHPANSGSLISLLTGGTVNPAARRQARRSEILLAQGWVPPDSQQVRPPRTRRKGIVKRIMQQDVMYLLIVNLPTPQEVQDSVLQLERAMAKGGISPY